MSIVPTKLALDGSLFLLIDFSDGSQRRYHAGALREACPCAACRAETPVVLPGLGVKSMRPIRREGYEIIFSDGHVKGLYTVPLLLELGEETRPPKK